MFSSASGIAATVLLIGFAALSIAAPSLWGEAATTNDITRAWQPPSADALLGTDELGRDVLARSLVATRLSLVSAFASAGIAIGVGLPIGLLASALGRRSTKVFSSIIGVLIAFPALLTAMFVGTIIGIGVPGAVIGVGVAMAPMFARLSQALAASIAKLDYVAAARTMGLGAPRVLIRHILPNVAEPLVIQGTTSVSISILGISALSFLGLGARPPEFDWGGLLNTGLKAIYFMPLQAFGPAVMIALAGIAFSLLGESIAGSISDSQVTGRMVRLGRRMAQDAKRAKAAARSGASARVDGADGGAATAGIDGVAATAEADGGAVPPVLDVQDLVVSFPSANGPVSPVRGVTFQLAAGERAGIVGESGSGKTLTVLAIAGLINYPGQATARRLAFNGQDTAAASPGALARILGTNLAMVFQNPMSSLNPAIRIGTQIAESSRVHRGLNAAEGRELAIAKLTEVAIPDPGERLRQYPHEFSGGMQQRAMIAMGLTSEPKLIVADEPTTALDVTVQRQILDLLERINAEEGTAILLISHDIAVVASMCQRVIVMYGGTVVEDLPVDRLLGGAIHPYTRALVDAVPDPRADPRHELATIPGRPPSSDEVPPGCAFAPRCTFATERCRAEPPPLSDHGGRHRAACWHPRTQTGAEPQDPRDTPEAGEAGGGGDRG
jgi:oligopeptide/dipeptide ABC transporter ATP-binding protein